MYLSIFNSENVCTIWHKDLPELVSVSDDNSKGSMLSEFTNKANLWQMRIIN